MKTITIKDIVATARGTEILLPLLTNEVGIQQWAQSIAMDTVTTKAGREISAARSALNGAQFAMTNVAMALRSATELGQIPYTRAVQETNRIYTMLDGLRTAFAGVRNEAHRELTVAEVTLSVKDGVFDELQSTSDAYTREELEELAREGSLSWESIDEILDMQEAKQATGQSELMESDGSWSESEGEFRTSVHTASQLWDMELIDIKYSESAAAAVALIGMQWPTEHPMWEPLLDRLADSWEASIEYAEDKEAAAKKVGRREAAMDDLHAKPMMARWAINHVTRRVFRDMVVLEMRAEDADDRLAYSERQAMVEERYGVPGSLTRPGMGEQPDLERKAFLLYSELNEAEVQPPQATGGDERALLWHGTQLDLDRTWHGAVAEQARETIDKLRSLYQQLRTMDLQLAKLWEIYGNDTMPSQPPLYWNSQGPIFDLTEAHAAIRIEANEAKQRARAAEGDALVKAAALVEQMLGL